MHRRGRREPRHADARAPPARLVPDGRARHALRDRRRRDRVRHPRQVPARLVRRLGRADAARRRRPTARSRSTPTPTRRVLGDRGRHGPHRHRHRGDAAAAAGRDRVHRPSTPSAPPTSTTAWRACSTRDDRLPLLGRVDRLPRRRQAPRPVGAHARQPRDARRAAAEAARDARASSRRATLAAHAAVGARTACSTRCRSARSTRCGSARHPRSAAAQIQTHHAVLPPARRRARLEPHLRLARLRAVPVRRAVRRRSTSCAPCSNG